MDNYCKTEKEIPQELFNKLYAIAVKEGIEGEEDCIDRAMYLHDFALKSKDYFQKEHKNTIQFMPSGIRDDEDFIEERE